MAAFFLVLALSKAVKITVAHISYALFYVGGYMQ